MPERRSREYDDEDDRPFVGAQTQLASDRRSGDEQ